MDVQILFNERFYRLGLISQKMQFSPPQICVKKLKLDYAYNSQKKCVPKFALLMCNFLSEQTIYTYANCK